MNGTALKRARLAKGLTLRALSAACEREGCPVDFSFLGGVERGEKSLGAGKVPVVLKVLDLDIKDLIPDAA